MTTALSPQQTITDITTLRALRDEAWASILQNAPWARFVMAGDYDRRFYGIYLTETFHYVKHNPKHQALVAVQATGQLWSYYRFCYEHAQEETGHEMMAFNDLINLGLTSDSVTLPPPHPATEVFIGYLYRVSTEGNPLRRLGYSFWAEDSYGYIGNLMKKITQQLALEARHTTFLVSHANIDEKHAEDVDKAIVQNCKKPDDWASLAEVMQTSLRLQSAMLDAVLEEYQALKANASDRYRFLNGGADT